MRKLTPLSNESAEILCDLTLRSVSGTFDVFSLHTTFNFRLSEIKNAYTALSSGMVDYQNFITNSEVFKIYIHEMMHYYQFTTTQSGHCIYRLQRWQDHIVELILRLCSESGVAPWQPLTKFIAHISPVLRKEIEPRVLDWLILESFIRWLTGDETGLSQTSSIIQRWLAFAHPMVYFDRLLEGINRSDEIKNFEKEQEQLYLPRVYKQETSKQLRNLIVEEIFGNMGVADVVESMATAAEFWNSECSVQEFDRKIRSDSYLGRKPYVYCLQAAAASIPATCLKEIVLTYLLICELALSGPMLHTQQIGIVKTVKFLDMMLPSQRLWWILSNLMAYKSHRAIKELSDYSKYWSNLCEFLGWDNPTKWFSSHTKLISHAFDVREALFAYSQRVRTEIPSFFIDIGDLLLGTKPSLQTHRRKFMPPASVFEDTVICLKGEEALDFYRILYTRSTILRQIMLGNNLNIRLPYPTSSEIRGYLLKACEEWLAECFSLEAPNLKISDFVSPAG